MPLVVCGVVCVCGCYLSLWYGSRMRYGWGGPRWYSVRCVHVLVHMLSYGNEGLNLKMKMEMK